MAFSEVLKPKGFKHLSVVLDADGKEVQVETREDAEQKLKLEKIIDLLYAAGYFRARIKGLSSFDKVVGGMTWCIDSFDVDIDVDLLFQENLTIGQRISLTEKIVAVLPKMKCPHRIEPHQIQGLDFIHIYPVIQWLVKHSMERRKETQEYYRSYALHQFEKRYTLPEDEVNKKFIEKASQNIAQIQETYRLHRRFRRVGPLPKDPAACAESTLFEYGLSSTVQERSSEDADAPKESQPQEIEKHNQQILSSMTSAPDQESRLTAGVVGNIVSMQAEEIAKAVEHYTELQAETEVSGAIQKRQLEEKCAQMEVEKQELEEKLQRNNQRLEELQEVNSKDLHNSSRILTEAEHEVLRKLQNLVTTNETLKQQEVAFKEQCKTELAFLQDAIRETEESNGEVEGERAGERQVVEQLAERVAAARLALGRRTRAVASLQRKLDQVPSRAELAQYQRRFMELYSQVAAKHRETKQFYTLYNTLNDKHQYLKKELSLLNSIQDSYIQAMATPAAKEQFMTQFEGIVSSIQQNKKKLEQKRSEERRQRDQLSAQLLALVEQQRQYVAALKQLMAECQNEVHRHANPLQL